MKIKDIINKDYYVLQEIEFKINAYNQIYAKPASTILISYFDAEILLEEYKNNIIPKGDNEPISKHNKMYCYGLKVIRSFDVEVGKIEVL